jgi:hypothetical protein
MENSFKRTPRNYKGIDLPHKTIHNMIPFVLKKIEKKAFAQDSIIISSWKKIIGEKLSFMTQAVKFEEGILYVKVKSHTLYSLLVQHERVKLVQIYQKKFPHASVKNIHFSLG